MSDIDLIKQKLDIVEIISETVKLRKSGRAFSGFCPFHSNTRTPAFYVFPDTQSWHCFGACSTGGDIFNFVMKRDNLEFGDALKLLAARAGVELHSQSSSEDTKLLLELQQVAAGYFHYLLFNHPEGQFARDYLKRRHISASSIENFQLGLSLRGWHNLQEHLEGKGYRKEDISRAGLISQSETTHAYHDRFRGRLMFPIRNRRGETIGFGARTLADEEPKYLNSPDTPLFSKSEVLYGFDMAREAIRKENLAVIVEGYTDVIIAHQEGFKNVIAAMGTSLTEKQLSQLQRLTHRYALALDADVAGAAATERGLELARQALTSKKVPVPVGPGLISFQERLDAELLVLEIPAGRDPDEVILEDRQLWQGLVLRAVPLIDHYLLTQTRDLDLNHSAGKFEAIRRLLPVIAEMKDNIQRRHYAQELARLVREDERTILSQIETRLPNVKKSGGHSVAAPAAPTRPTAKFAEHMFSLVLKYPELLPRVQFLSEEDFADGSARELWRAIQRYNSSAIEFDVDGLLDTLTEGTRTEGERLFEAGKQFQFEELEAVRELEAAAYRLRLQHDRDELMQLQYALAGAEEEERPALDQRADRLRQRIAEAQRALSRRTVLKSGSSQSL